MLQLLEEPVGLKLDHLSALHGYDGAETQKVSHVLYVFFAGSGGRGIFLLLLGERGKLGRLGHHLKRTVGGEVKHVAFRFHARLSLVVFIAIRTLHTEDGLHVGGGRSVFRTFQIEYSRPWLYCHPSGEPATGYGDGVSLLGLVAYAFEHLVEGILTRLVVVVGACHIDYCIETAKHLVVVQQALKSLGLLHARHHPKRVVELLAVFVG